MLTLIILYLSLLKDALSSYELFGDIRQQNMVVSYRRFWTGSETSVCPRRVLISFTQRRQPEITHALQTSYITQRHGMSAW
jgi:hypothetical protein